MKHRTSILFLIVLLITSTTSFSIQIPSAKAGLAGYSNAIKFWVAGSPDATLTNYPVSLEVSYNSNVSSQIIAPYANPFCMSAVNSSGGLFAIHRTEMAIYASSGGEWGNLTLLHTFPNSPSRVISLFIDSQDNLFVNTIQETSGNDGNVWRSADNGVTWICANTNNLADDLPRSVALWGMDEDNASTLFGGVWGGTNSSCLLVKSTDWGLTWTSISDAAWANQDHVHGCRVDNSTGWLYAALGDNDEDDGLWRSKIKDGSDWVFKCATAGTNDHQYIGIVFKGGYVYLSGDSSIKNEAVQRFQDDGTATRLTPSTVLNNPGSSWGVFAMEKDRRNYIWVFLRPSHGYGYVWVSKDGTTWTAIDTSAADADVAEWTTRLGFGYSTRGATGDDRFLVGTDNQFATYWFDEASNQNYSKRYLYEYNYFDLGGNVQTDFDDIRFTDSTNTTNYDYWIEEKVDSDYAKIWIEIPSIPQNDHTLVYLHHNNVGASAGSNGPNTFQLFDNFDDNSLDGTIWKTGNSGGVGSVTETNQRLEIAHTGDGASTVHHFVVGNVTVSANQGIALTYDVVWNGGASIQNMVGDVLASQYSVTTSIYGTDDSIRLISSNGATDQDNLDLQKWISTVHTVLRSEAGGAAGAVPDKRIHYLDSQSVKASVRNSTIAVDTRDWYPGNIHGGTFTPTIYIYLDTGVKVASSITNYFDNVYARAWARREPYIEMSLSEPAPVTNNAPTVTSFVILDLSGGDTLYTTLWYRPRLIVDDSDGFAEIDWVMWAFETDKGWHNISYDAQADVWAKEAGGNRFRIQDGYTESSGTELSAYFYFKAEENMDVHKDVDVYTFVNDTSGDGPGWALTRDNYFEILEYEDEPSSSTSSWTPSETPTMEPQDDWVDTDGDGIPNWDDPDIDGDDVPNDYDPDIDGDEIPNEEDPDPYIPEEPAEPKDYIFSFKTPSGKTINLIPTEIFTLEFHQKLIIPWVLFLLLVLLYAIYRSRKNPKKMRENAFYKKMRALSGSVKY